jgi:hypothetical protein
MKPETMKGEKSHGETADCKSVASAKIGSTPSSPTNPQTTKHCHCGMGGHAIASVNCPVHGDAPMTEEDKRDRDMLIYGTGFMMDGKHVPIPDVVKLPERVSITEMCAWLQSSWSNPDKIRIIREKLVSMDKTLKLIVSELEYDISNGDVALATAREELWPRIKQ